MFQTLFDWNYDLTYNLILNHMNWRDYFIQGDLHVFKEFSLLSFPEKDR